MSPVPQSRIRRLNRAAPDPGGGWVVYWMTAARRASHNYGLQRAAELAAEYKRPLVVLEALRLDYPWASRRIHDFILQGMAENARAFKQSGVLYHPYVEASPGAGKGLLLALARNACLVVADDFPCFFIPRMLDSAAAKLPVRLEAVDSCGIIPLGLAEKEYGQAVHFRRFIRKHLLDCLAEGPRADPLKGLDIPPPGRMPKDIRDKWPAAGEKLLSGDPGTLSGLGLTGPDPAPSLRGGSAEALARLDRFIKTGLPNYLKRNQPDAGAESGLSPYLHFGHISPHQVFGETARSEGWSPLDINPSNIARREGWWGAAPEAESFWDQVITWRELGYHFCRNRPDYDQYQCLPQWARQSLEAHAADPRPYLYSLEQLDRAETHDEIWNAAQTQLVLDGVIHNYLRMLWGKKIIQWSPHPKAALEVMIELNNRYALDGRDPNSYSGIMWCLGRFDRGWSEREVFGKVRYMSSRSARRKLKLAGYLARYGVQGGLFKRQGGEK